MTISSDETAVADGRAGSLARRMLGGSAAASLHAYRMDDSLPFVAHGLTADGSLVVAAYPSGALGDVPPGVAVDVRLDAVKQTPDPAVSIVAASVHLLGTLTWASVAEVTALLSSGSLPALMAGVLETTGARLGFVDPGRVVLHDMDGATVIPLEEIRVASAGLDDEHDAFAAVAGYGQPELKDLVWAVLVGAVPGVTVSKAPLPNVCPHTADRVFCVDVDPTGVTVMLVGREETLIVFACFASPVASQAELRGRLGDLMAAASPLAA